MLLDAPPTFLRDRLPHSPSAGRSIGSRHLRATGRAGYLAFGVRNREIKLRLVKCASQKTCKACRNALKEYKKTTFFGVIRLLNITANIFSNRNSNCIPFVKKTQLTPVFTFSCLLCF